MGVLETLFLVTVFTSQAAIGKSRVNTCPYTCTKFVLTQVITTSVSTLTFLPRCGGGGHSGLDSDSCFTGTAGVGVCTTLVAPAAVK